MLNLALPARTPRTPRHRWLAALALITITLTAGAGAARAQAECFVGQMLGGMDMSVNFGLYNGTQDDAMSPSTLTINCKTGSNAARIYVCVGLGAGSAAGSTVTNRRMNNATGTSLSYQLYSDAARTKVFQIISSSTPPSQQYSTILPAHSAGDRNTGIRIYGRIPAQTITEAGTYTSTFSGNNFDVRWKQSASNVLQIVDCKSLPKMPGTTTAVVQAQVEAKCEISVAQHVDFGEITLTSPFLPGQSAEGKVQVRCDPEATYNIEMGDGLYPQNAGTTNARRRMRHATDTTKTLRYELFKPNASGGNSFQRWGLIANSQHLTATGSNDEHTVHARTGNNTSVIAGTYQDTVVVTLSY